MSEPIDSSVLDALRRFEKPGRPSVIARLVETMLATVTPELEALGKAAESGQDDALHRCAHKLKTSFANVGARGASDLCRRLELDASPREVPALVAELRRLFPEVERALRGYVSGSPAR